MVTNIFSKISNFFLTLLVIRFCFITCIRIPIKVVQEPATYGNVVPVASQANFGSRSIRRLKASNFSGPPHLMYLKDNCYTHTDSKYRYTLCPFHNMSQSETVYRWNAYDGILGIWKQWEIENNTFVSMLYEDGDSCGTTSRTVKVHLVCGSESRLKNVSEPRRCEYEAQFHSPFVCSSDALFVYPILEEKMQRKWDRLHTQLNNGDITQKGYLFWLEDIFVKSGLRIGRQQSQTSKAPTTVSTTPNTNNANSFGDLSSCNTAYEELKHTVERLRSELAELKSVNNVSQSTNQ